MYLIFVSRYAGRCGERGKHKVSQSRLEGESLQCVDDTRNITENGEQNVDQEIGSASSLEENTERWKEDGKAGMKLLVSCHLEQQRGCASAVR